MVGPFTVKKTGSETTERSDRRFAKKFKINKNKLFYFA